MAEIIFLDPDDDRPDGSDDDPWLYIDERDGKFFGSGGAFDQSGKWVGYGSLDEDDVSLEKAILAAQKWAARFAVDVIYVFARR